MIFVGFMDGSKSICYYDPSTRKIKVYRNVAFNDNEEPRELEIMTDILGLPVKGEIGTISPAQTTPESTTQLPETQIKPIEEEDNENKQETTPERRELRVRTKDIDYKLSGNPQARIPGARKASTKPTPLQYTPTPSPAPDVT